MAEDAERERDHRRTQPSSGGRFAPNGFARLQSAGFVTFAPVLIG